MQELLKEKLDSLKEKFNGFPSKSRWKLFFRVLTREEKIIFFSCFICFLIALYSLSCNFYFKHTKVVPAPGGTFIEGIVGQPRFINPILQSSDVDRDLVELLFAGLMKYDENGKIVPDMAEKYEILEEGKVYQITLKQDILWHDGQKITADDVIFTIKTIQDPEIKSPEITNWIDIEVEKVSEQKINFKLKNPYFPFLERLTIKIVPKHIFGEIPAGNLALTSYNLQPIGSGPFRFQTIKYDKLGKVESLDLIRNESYFGKLPYFQKIRFLFFENEEFLAGAAQRKEIQGFVISNPENIDIFERNDFILYEIPLPRYFAAFLNPEKSEALAKEKVRKALELGINKTEVLEKAIENRGKIVDSPLLPWIYGFKEPEGKLGFSQEQARKLLEEAGFTQKDGKFFKVKTAVSFSFNSDLEKGSKGKEVEALQKCLSFFPEIYPQAKVTGYFGEETEQAVILFQEKYREDILKPWDFDKGTGTISKTTRNKLNEVCNQFTAETSPLKFSLVTVNQPFLTETAKLLKEQWEALGLEIEIKVFEFNELTRDFIKPREYEILLFGEALGIIPDPLAFWHSSRIKDPGLNLAMYESKKADEYLEKARTALNPEEFKENLEKFQAVAVGDAPAIFLYSPNFLYFVSKETKGVSPKLIADPSKRFIGVEQWYLLTKRVWK